MASCSFRNTDPKKKIKGLEQNKDRCDVYCLEYFQPQLHFIFQSKRKETVCRQNSGAYSIEIFSGALPYPCGSRERENGGFAFDGGKPPCFSLQLLD